MNQQVTCPEYQIQIIVDMAPRHIYSDVIDTWHGQNRDCQPLGFLSQLHDAPGHVLSGRMSSLTEFQYREEHVLTADGSHSGHDGDFSHSFPLVEDHLSSFDVSLQCPNQLCIHGHMGSDANHHRIRTVQEVSFHILHMI